MAGAVKIQDDGGAEDILKFLNTKKNDLIFMANYNTEDLSTFESAGYEIVKDGSLFIFDKTSNGFIQIKDFYKTNTSFGRTHIDKSEYGNGYIENILAGKKNVNSMIETYTTGVTGAKTNIAALGLAIDQWIIDKHGRLEGKYKYESISEIMDNQDWAKDFITTFIQKQ